MRLTPLKLKRMQAGKLQVELAAATSIGHSRLSMMENGHITPRPDELQRLAAALGVPTDALVRRTS